MHKNYEVLSERDWPKNRYIPIATVNLQPEYFVENNKAKFFQSEEQIGLVQTAYLKLNSGLYVMLMFIEFTPEEGISICVQESLKQPVKEYLNEIINILMLDRKVISWEIDQFVWESLF
ncbi:hypothetical protein [Aliikangiella coralliicola]|uniref:Uncharacterized protein n=1 Tax=Aliikangiella coralliicola TaxID=2592383 RepID=A0A545UEQ7_9GAMM|nr:hypothetical protein [Aliikangiella coralliicola]TQV87954.1 hypothetical protein FLL46_11285 [Aliikangiella coralliicola]